MSSDFLLDFTPTPLESVVAAHGRVVQGFHSGRTYPLEYRKVQLRKLYYAVADHEKHIYAAVKADLNKPDGEIYMAEFAFLLSDILFVLANLDKWAADESGDVELQYKLMNARYRKEPLGAVLIIGAFNYPFMLSLSPLVGAIAGGNSAVVKPSEMSPHSAAVIARIVGRLDQDCYACVNGSIPETTRLLEYPWDKICYTGNSSVAKIITSAAAKFLTPCLLELGGMNPCFVTASADARLAAKRIAWGKTSNAGQICLGPDYVLVHPSQEAAFVEGFISAMKKFYPNGTKEKSQLSRMVNARHFHRIKKMLDTTQGTIVFGGETDEEENFIAPTLVKVNSTEDSLLAEEVFGPVLPFLIVESTDKMLEISKRLGDTPLACYVFSSNKAEQEKILSRTRSGGASVNDVVLHGGIVSLPFGGVGQSGTGAYRGKASFDAFTHKRTVITVPSWIESLISVRYPPFTRDWVAKYRKASGYPKPDFDRNGKPHYSGTLWTVLFLGAKGPKKALLRYLLAVFMGLALASKRLHA